MPFIIGAPRSGTTLLRFMLDSHPDLAIPPETGFLKLVSRFPPAEVGLCKRFFRAVTTYPDPAPAWPDFGISENSFYAALSDISPFTVEEGIRCFYRLYASRFAKPRWGDKTPTYGGDMEAIRAVLPEARFIHIIRDGRDVALSLRRQWFSPGPDVETQARAWRDSVSTACEAGAGRDDYLEIRYEDLILGGRPVLERVCRFIHLEFRETMLHYYKRTPERLLEHRGRRLPDGGSITDEQRREQQKGTLEPPDPTRVYGWIDSMAPDDQVEFERTAGSLLQKLGYQTTSI